MIQNLLNAISDLLQTELDGQLPRSGTHFAAVPIAEPAGSAFPAIAIYPGNWSINQSVREVSLNEPRPQDLRQVIPINPPKAKAAYPLEKTPLKGTVRGSLVINGQQQPLQEGDDFTIDYQKSILTLTAKQNLSNAKQIILDYSFPGIFTIREFQQEFWIDIYDQAFAQLEQWSSLITGILINRHDGLIEQYNTPTSPKPKTEYQTGQFVTTHTLSQFRLLEGIYIYPKTGIRLQLKFMVVGQIKMTQAIAESIVPIQTISITGSAAEQTINTTT